MLFTIFEEELCRIEEKPCLCSVHKECINFEEVYFIECSLNIQFLTMLSGICHACRTVWILKANIPGTTESILGLFVLVQNSLFILQINKLYNEISIANIFDQNWANLTYSLHWTSMRRGYQKLMNVSWKLI